MSEIQAICGIITTVCTLLWIANQWFFYRIFKDYFSEKNLYERNMLSIVVEDNKRRREFEKIIHEEENRRQEYNEKFKLNNQEFNVTRKTAHGYTDNARRLPGDDEGDGR